LWAALSWIIPAYLLKPPPDNPDGKLKLTMPPMTRGTIVILVIAFAACAVVSGTLIGYSLP
jgi:hypothetical protein